MFDTETTGFFGVTFKCHVLDRLRRPPHASCTVDRAESSYTEDKTSIWKWDRWIHKFVDPDTLQKNKKTEGETIIQWDVALQQQSSQ